LSKPESNTPEVTDADLDKIAAGKAAQSHRQGGKPKADAPAEKHVDKEVDVKEEFQSQKANDHFKIIVPSTGAVDEVKRIVVIPNGVFYSFVRDEEVVVPKAVLDALDIAQETRFRDAKDSDGKAIKVPYKVKSYPYQIIDGPLPPPGIVKATEL
jgi:hypothetical protein